MAVIPYIKMKKNVLILGGTSGIGLALAEKISTEKFNITVCGRSNINLKKNKIKFEKLDILKKKNLENFISKYKKYTFDIIVHIIGGSLGENNPFAKIESYQKIWDYKLGYVIKINNFFVKKMIKKKWGRVVHFSSAASFINSGSAPYGSAKSALNYYVKNVGSFVSKHNVIMTAISAGPFENPKKHLTKIKNKKNIEWKNFIKNNLPIGRLAKINEIVDVIEFLISKKSSYCSGAIWNVDGSQK